MVKKSELTFNEQVFPKRLVDVPATVASNGGFFFVVPTDWDFHIISHTWTDATSALSTDCQALASKSGVEYNQSFAKAGLFSDKDYYKSFIEFFAFLQGDGVEKVWIDVLCINQLDDEEKASEMVNMGAYYNLSKACYVATHGLGSPNGFKVLDSNTKIARWFSRVWCLQESILPLKIYFLVEKFEDNIIEYIKNEPTSHFQDKAWIDWDANEDKSSNGEDADQFKYVRGGGDRSRRKVGSSTNLYFLGAKAYFEMMGTLLGVHVQGLEDLSPKLFEDFYEAFGELASGDQDIFLETIVKQIRVRNASVEEDRVLGILGLIGFKKEHSLVANQGLNKQIVALAKLLFNEGPEMAHVLINLCAAEYEGYEVEGISWAPDMRADPVDTRAEFRMYFIDYVIVKKYEAKVKSVNDDGSLVMRAQVAHGELIRTDDKAGTSYYIKVGSMAINFSHDNDLDDNLPLHTYYVDETTRAWVGGIMVAAPNIQKIKAYSTDKPLHISDITLVYLGDDRDVHKRGSTCVLMACIPLGGNAFHKIGTIHPNTYFATRARKLFLSQAEDIVIGGVGGDLTPYLKKECQSALKSLA